MSGSGTNKQESRGWKHVKEFLKMICGKLAESLAAKIATLTVICFCVLAFAFWKWLKTEHSLQIHGWLWAAGVLVIAGLPTLTLCFIQKRRRKTQYHSDGDILVVLQHRLRRYADQKDNEILVDFRECDRKWHLPKGSAQRLLPGLVEKDTTWAIKNAGDDTMTIIREDPRITALKRLNRT